MASENKNRRLQELGGSDYEMADGQPNIKGWDVKDENGRTIGEVDELIFDTQSLKVRYLVVDLDDNDFDLDDREVLIPVGMAQLHDKDDDVILPGVTAEQLRALPEYDDDDELDSTVENQIRAVFAGSAALGAATTGNDADFYNHEHFNDNRLYRNRQQTTGQDQTIPVIEENLEVGKQEVETGGIRLRSRIVEKEVEEDINLREETVNVERTQVDRPATAADMKEETIEATESKEVPVVNKEARVVEEISLNKEVNERDETISDTVRKTEVDIDKLDEDDTRRPDSRS